MSMETRKIEEIQYYNKHVQEGEKGDFEGFEPRELSSFRFFYDAISRYAKDKRILDYGCGNGVHTAHLLRAGAKEVVGIDLSERSLEIAKKHVQDTKASFVVMDCENLEFSNNSFDVVIDGGTFSSLDIEKAYGEISRVLQPNGVLIGIETFGHNPIANLKRLLNKKTGKRTEWAAAHILKTKDVEKAKRYFHNVEVKYFHAVSWIAIPVFSKPGGKLLLKVLEVIDRVVNRIPFIRRMAFKVVFICTNPRK